MAVRNTKKRGFIDMRDARVCRTSETDTSFTITLYVREQHMETQTFTMRKAAMAKTVSEHKRTYWARFISALHLPLDARREVEIKGMNGAHIVVHHWSEDLPAFEFNGVFDAFDIAPHDSVILEFRVDSGKITSVEVSVEQAKDKALTRELEEMLARSRADYDLEVGWDNFAWLVRRAYAASKLIAVQGRPSMVQIDFGRPEDFLADAVFIEWEWDSASELSLKIGCSANSSRFPSEEQRALLASLGWYIDWEDDDGYCPRIYRYASDEHPQETISNILQALRFAFNVAPTDNAAVTPVEVAMLVSATSPETMEEAKNSDGRFTREQIAKLRNR